MAPFVGGPETRWTLTIDHHGRVLASTAHDQIEVTAVGMASAAAADELGSAGVVAHLGELELWSVRGAKQSTTTGVTDDTLLVVAVDPSKGTAGAEKALQAWRAAARPAETSAPAKKPPPLPARPARAAAPTSPDLERAWAALRRALVRGQLTEASARFREVARGLTDGSPEAIDAERAMQRLLQGIGSVLAGDGVAGFETLAPVAAPDHRIPSLRWAALQWSAWAALRSNRVPLAVEHASAALELGGQLDSEAIAVSQITAADIVAIGGDATRAIAWLTEARTRFESLGDLWGIAQTWLHESRVHAGSQREAEATAAARRAWTVRRDWDEPPLFLAHRALLRGEHGAAAEFVKGLTSPAADRIRALIEAVRAGTAAQTDVRTFLEVQEAPPSASAIRALGELASRSPRFVQAREALAWMLLKCGRYADAGAVFRALLACELTQGDRASVLLGLGCVAQAGQGRDAAQASRPAGATSDSAPTPASNGAAADAVFSGQLSLFPLPDVLEFLRSARRSGVLACSSAGGMAALHFEGGSITRAACSGVPTTGEILVAAGKISREALAAAGAAASNGAADDDETAIDRLVRDRQLDLPTVRLAVTRQIELCVRRLVQWRNGEFAFNQDTAPDTASPPWAVAIDPQGILLEVFRQLDEGVRDEGAEAAP